MGLGMHSGGELTIPPAPPEGRGVSPTPPGMVVAVPLAFFFLLGLVQVKEVRLKVLRPKYINIKQK